MEARESRSRKLHTAMAACCYPHPFISIAVHTSPSRPSLVFSHHSPRRLSLRASSSSSSEPEDDLQAKLQQADWRAFRARLLQTTASLDSPLPSSANHQHWAHALSQPEPGCLLLAHPTAFLMRQQYFHQAVIFLFAHTKEGSAGLIINRPTEYNLGQLAGFEDLLPEFGSCPLYMGGDVGANALHSVHGVPRVEDSVEIVSGVYMGGFKSMKSSVQSGQHSAMDYRLFVRYSGWGPGQLEREVAMGVWYVACCSKDIILKHCIQLPKPLWREVLELMGDPYADISKRAYGEL